MKRYMPRLADEGIEKSLRCIGAVVLRGPKGCGKTATAMEHCNSALHLDDAASFRQNRQMAMIEPSRLLAGDTPRLIDEVPLIPIMWDAVYFEVDRRGCTPGQFIATQSSDISPKALVHNHVAGRMAFAYMEPMTLYESGDSDGSVSLGDLFNNPPDINGFGHMDLDRLAFLVCRGGWPGAMDKTDKEALKVARHCYEDIVNSGITRLDGVRRSPDRVNLFLRAYSMAIGTQASKPDLASDMQAHDKAALDLKTMDSYMAALKGTYIITELEAIRPVLNTGATGRSAPTREFTDPSLACAALKLKPDDLINNLDLFSVLFKSMCIRDLRVYVRCLNGYDGGIYHYKDSTGLEVDAVVKIMKDGRDIWCAIETDLGVANCDELAAKLLKFKDRVKHGEMIAFLMILSGTSRFAYRRPDGVFVVPIGCLKP